ncbi:MBL fold metallo-hydrolase [bacterium]|nr:MBL fold metallo-hydrolase [bacterium]
MKLAVLVDNNTNLENCLIPEHGLSFYIEDDDKKIIFDCGTTDAFIKNAYKMGIDLEYVTDIILSHSHDDHIGGFMKLKMLYQKFSNIGIEFRTKNIYAHPKIFETELENNNSTPGEKNIHLEKEEIRKVFNIIDTKKAQAITDKFYLTGEIPVIHEVKKDYTQDEIALIYKSKAGLVIISGCSHSGLENIIEQAKAVTGESKINTIIGGIYLINRSVEEVHELGHYLKEQNIEYIYPCHCTDLESKIILSRYVKIAEVNIGKEFSWE